MNEERVFGYLDDLYTFRRGNMEGAARFLVRDLVLTLDEANDYLVRWQKTLDGRVIVRRGIQDGTRRPTPQT